MKRVQINKGQVGLVFKKWDYKRVLTAGNYWLGFGEEVALYDMRLNFNPNISLDILLQDEALASLLDIIEVADNEIAIVHENKMFKYVLTAGRYAYWKGLVERTYKTYDTSAVEFDTSINKSLYPKLYSYMRLFEVATYEKALLLVDDVYTKTLSGGTYRFWNNETTIKLLKVDTRQLQLEISGQELLTKDKANVRINFNTQYKVVAIEKALLENKDYECQLYTALQLALRKYVGTYTLDELLENKEDISNAVFEDIKQTATKLGVEVLTCGIRDIILTGEMKDIMNQVLIAQKQAQANIITRREETASTRSLLNTAKLMEDNEMLFKLKEMEYIEKIADKIGEISVSGNGNVINQLKEIFGKKA